MNLRAVPGRALDQYLKALRLPVTAAERVATRGGKEPAGTFAPGLLFDRVDAGVRAAAGGVLGDATLTEEARRIRLAADERERAARLAAAAETTEVEAERRAELQQEAADRKRREAEAKAEADERRLQAEARRREQQVEKRAASKKATVRRISDAEQKEIGGLTVVAATEHLERHAETLEAESKAAKVDVAAARLESAAAATKAARKKRNAS